MNGGNPFIPCSTCVYHTSHTPATHHHHQLAEGMSTTQEITFPCHFIYSLHLIVCAPYIHRTVARMQLFPLAFALLVVFFMARDVSAQNGYVVRGAAKVINGNTVRVSGVDVTLSGVKTMEKYDRAAARSLKKRIGNKQVGCMVDGNWSGKNWGYCTSTGLDPRIHRYPSH